MKHSVKKPLKKMKAVKHMMGKMHHKEKEMHEPHMDIHHKRRMSK